MSAANDQAPESGQGDPFDADEIVATVRKAGEGAADPKSARLARQARAAQLDMIGAIALIAAGSPEGVRLRSELRGLDITAKSLDASLSWYRRQKADGKGWQDRLIRNTEGDLEGITANAITILRNDAAWANVLAWDDFAQAITFRSEPPWYDDDRPAEESGVLDDYNAPAVTAWLARAYHLKISDESTYKAARTVAMGVGHRYDSLRDWLRSLRWDGKFRIGGPDTGPSWLTTYLGVPDNAYTRFVGRAWIISGVARGMVPGEQVDHILIAEGAQGEGKTSAFRLLFGERFSDSPLSMHDKDRFVNLRAIHGQSFDELAGLGRADQQVVKNYLTMRVDIFRPPYGRDPVKVPRRTVFCGTVNPRPGMGYLKDDTGARRFWPVRCGVAGPMLIAPKGPLDRDRDQLWAEALLLYESGIKWYPTTAAERAMCRDEQEERQERDVWEDRVKAYLDSTGRFERIDMGEHEFAPNVPRPPLQHVTVDAVLQDALAVPPRDQGQIAQNRIASIMASIGWLHLRSTIDGIRAWRYHRPPAATLEERQRLLTVEAERLRAELGRLDEHAMRVALELEAARVANESDPAP